MQKFDAVVIGAGIIGCAVGLELSRMGYRTLNIDKLADADFGSTANTCAIIRTHYSTRDGVAMAFENYHYWKEWAKYIEVGDELGLAHFIESGAVILRSPAMNWNDVWEFYDEFGIQYHKWDMDTLARKLPFYNLDSYHPPKRPEDEAFWAEPTQTLEGAFFLPQAGYINDPVLSTHNIMRAAESKGTTFRFNSEVAEVRRDVDKVLGVTLTDGTRIDAGIVVNVAGPHSFVINRMAGVEAGMNIRTRALRHEVHHVPSPQGVDFAAEAHMTSDSDNGCYFRPESGNQILIGSEDPDCDERVWIENPDHYDREITQEQWKTQVYRLAKRIPTLTIPNQTKGIVDLYDVSDDWIPIYDKSDLQGFYMAVGTSGNQYKNAPVAGKMMARMIQRCEQGIDQDEDPLQYPCEYTGLTLNSGFYSRRREINPNSSFTVRG